MTLRYCSFDLGDSGPIDIHRNGCIIIFSRDICPKSKVVPVCCWSKSPNNIQSRRVEIQSTAFGCESGANEKIHFENPSTKSHPTYPGYASNQQNIFELQIMIRDFTYHKLASLYIIGVDWGNFTNQLFNFQTLGPFSNCHCRQSGRCCGSRSPRQNLFTWAKVGVFWSLKQVVHWTNRWKMLVGLPGRRFQLDFLDFWRFNWYFFLVSWSSARKWWVPLDFESLLLFKLT